MKKVASIHSFLECIKTHQELHCSDDEMLFFRGLTDNKYDLKPSAFRQGKGETESNAYHDIMMEYPEQFSKKEHLSNLVKMQHYGLRTRLLDVSRNPLISLYFACEQKPSVNGKVVAFKVKKSEVLHHNSDKALMLACIPAFSDEEQQQIKEFCEKYPDIITDDKIKDNAVMKRFLHEIRSEFPAFETAIIGKDLLKNYFGYFPIHFLRIYFHLLVGCYHFRSIFHHHCHY